MRSCRFALALFLLASAAGIATASADKLAAYGLDSEGRPLLPEPPPPIPHDALFFDGTGAHCHGGGTMVQRPELAAARRGSVEEQVRTILQLLADGPTFAERWEHGARPIFPEGTQLHRIDLTESGVVEVRAAFPESFLDDVREGRALLDPLSHAIDDNLFDLPISGHIFLALDRESGEYVPISSFEPGLDFIDAEGEIDLSGFEEYREALADGRRQYPAVAGGQHSGALSDRRVYLNAGHGWTWRTWDGYGVQRTFVHNNIEDFSNADLVHNYVTRYLINAGADVFNVREWDPNPHMVIVDNDDGAPDYVETGSWSNSILAGFANGHAPYGRTDNPFSNGTNRLTPCVTGEPTATATWIPTIPESGFYNVYVSHAAFSNRSPQAEYIVRHAGGESTYYIDQRRNRFTWIFIGRYYFDAGRDESRASVTLTNRSTSSEHFVSADAVRFGGGLGVVAQGNAGTSGHRRYDEEAVYHMSFSGAPTSVHRASSTSGDEQNGWGGRPRFAAWLQDGSTQWGAPAMPAVALANHTNATATGTARGTISYIHSSWEPSTPGGNVHDRFRRAVHPQVVNGLVNGYGAGFNQNSNPYRSGGFGEANPNNSGGIPIFLGEWLFHDNAADMALYHDPKFRRMMARGIYQGIVRFFAEELNQPSLNVFLPEPPRNLRVSVTGTDSVQLQWQAPAGGNRDVVGDPATGYRIYKSTHGRGFPAPTNVTGTTTTIGDLEPGVTYYFKVTATNAGGESFPTETLAARIPDNTGAPKILIVNGFDKTDIATRVHTPWGGGTLYRQFVEEMNTFDYIVEHARAIDAWGQPIGFDSAEHDAVEAQLVNLGDYPAVIWIGGIQAEVSTTDPTDDTALKANTRTALANYLSNGGRLFMSGAEIGWDLDRIGGGAANFMRNTLKFDYVNDGPGFSVASGTEGSVFEGIGSINFGGGGSPYQVHWPDILETQGGSVAALEYGMADGGVLIDGFEVVGTWRHPGFSGQTNADPDSSFTIASSPVRSGNGSGNLNYIWGTGDFIRLYNSGLPEFPADSDFSIWVHGDNSGHRVRICLRDSDNDLFVSDWLVIDFNGWREIRWEDVANNPQNVWVPAADGSGDVVGPNVRFDSIQVQKVTAQNSGNLYFDDAMYEPLGATGPTNPVAAVQYEGDYHLVHLGFPFETIVSESQRNAVMQRTLDFFGLPTSGTGIDSSNWLLY